MQNINQETETRLNLSRSHELLERAKEVVPTITHSMMKCPEQFSPGAFPVYVAEGRGAEVVDVDGNKYIDFICGLGANSLGYRHPEIEAAILTALSAGYLHSLPTEMELDVAEAVVRAVPGAEMARFFKTGADATSVAVRLARAITGRDGIIVVGYNGFHDHFMFDTPGVPTDLKRFTRRVLLMPPDAEQRLLGMLEEGTDAAVLLTIPYNRVLSRQFVQQVRDVCKKNGILLIMDEIVTGFRLGEGGAQSFYDVNADLVCVSKALAGGMPLSAIVGSRNLLSHMERLQVSTTFGGETLSLAACGAALHIYESSKYYAHLAHLGRLFKEGINEVAKAEGSNLRVVGYDPLPLLLFDRDPAKHVPQATQFVGKMAERGFLLRRDLNFICLAHTEDQIGGLVRATAESLRAMK